MTEGVDPYAFLQSASGQLDGMDAASLDRLLDDVEYLYEVMDPELQHLAEQVMEGIQARLEPYAAPDTRVGAAVHRSNNPPAKPGP